MASINDIKIDITMNTASVSVKGFGLPLVLGSRETGDDLSEVYGEYGSLAEMSEAGFAVTDAEYKMAGKIFAQSPHPELVAVYCREQDHSISEALSDLIMSRNDWYVLLITERDSASLHEAGDWCLENEKLFFGCTAAIDSLVDRNNNREAYMLHDAPDTYPEAAWVGLCLPRPIGSITWKWKSPTGVKAAGYSSTQLRDIRSKHAQTLTARSGEIYSNEGITTGGEYIDNMMSRDYVKARLEEGLLRLQLKSDKVAMDASGLEKIRARMKEVLDEAGAAGVIGRVTSEEEAELSDEGMYMYKITVPDRSQIQENDRAARRIRGIKFSFTVAGAVHEMTVNGTIEV